MGFETQFKKLNRRRNAGGVFPDANTNMLALANVFAKIKTNRQLIVWLYLWLSGTLETIKSTADIPDLIRITNSDRCQSNTLRIYPDGRESWVEYSLGYSTQGGMTWLWQPVPTVLNSLFIDVLRQSGYNKPILDQTEKLELFTRLNNKQKKNTALNNYRLATRQSLFRYFTHCIQSDPKLSTLSKWILLPSEKLHHQSAHFYQYENSDRIRSRIFNAQNSYLDRLSIPAKASVFLSLFNRKMSNAKTLNLFKDKQTKAFYLEDKETGHISQYSMPPGQASISAPEAPILIGTSFALPYEKVATIFEKIQTRLEQLKPAKRATIQDLINYYNHMTYCLALQFIALTGARPTHHILFERSRCFGSQTASICDKGKMRMIWICPFLQNQIANYVAIQQQIRLRLMLSEQHQPTTLCYLIDATTYEPTLLTAKRIHTFLHRYDKTLRPYQFRHHFAQYLLEHGSKNNLSTHDLDLLMGHSRFGEHIGSQEYFPLHTENYLKHLEQLASYLQLRRFI